MHLLFFCLFWALIPTTQERGTCVSFHTFGWTRIPNHDIRVDGGLLPAGVQKVPLRRIGTYPRQPQGRRILQGSLQVPERSPRRIQFWNQFMLVFSQKNRVKFQTVHFEILFYILHK